MIIRIPVYQGYNEALSKGWSALLCPHCQRVQPFECFEVWRAEHVAFIKLADTKLNELLRCGFCGAGYTCSNDAEMPRTALWEPEEGLQKLVEKTNPKLGKIEIPDEVTIHEMEALCLSIHEQTSMSSNRSTPMGCGGFLLGIIFAVLGTLAFSAGWMAWTGFSKLGNLVLFFCIGAAVGAIVAGQIYAKYQRRSEGGKIFKAAVGTRPVDIDKLWKVSAQYPIAGHIAATWKQ